MAMQHFLVLGIHPRLSLAEINAVLPQTAPPIVCGSAVLVQAPSWDGMVLMNKLGGTVKLGDIIGELPLAQVSAESVAQAVAARLRGKTSLDFGWTVFGGTPVQNQKLSRLASPFKKELRAQKISVRWVTGKGGKEIAPAAVAKLKLTTQGMDVCLLVNADKVAIGLTTDVQDADAWSLRDFGRPARSALSGMLPPKLARIMVNLAQIPANGIVADPFCGSGTILMEAALATQAPEIIGSDNDARQIADTETNDAWLFRERILHKEDATRFNTFIADARQLTKHLKPKSVDCIVTEGFLGPPLKGRENQQDLDRNAALITQLWSDSLMNWKSLLKPRAQLIVIWPEFKTPHAQARVNLEPELKRLGYRLVPFSNKDISLVYKRPDQYVARHVIKLQPLD